MTRLPGIRGALFPSRYLAEGWDDRRPRSGPTIDERDRHRFERWWRNVALACGPASALRAIFDLFAMPLFAMLGFRARRAEFERGLARAILETRAGTSVALVLLPWASQPTALWRDAVDTAARFGASWCFVGAPPYLTLVDARGHATRRSVDFSFPAALDAQSFARFHSLTGAEAFDRAPELHIRSPPRLIAPIDRLVEDAERFQSAVRTDLQRGVELALDALGRVVRSAEARADADERLTIVYRILFLLFAESRDLVPRLHPVYGPAYAVGALCRDALAAPKGVGLWDGLAAITRLSRAGCRTEDLIVRPFNGRLFARVSAPSLERSTGSRRTTRSAGARDAVMRDVLTALASRPGRGGREDITYADLGVEQLGAVYERVLDLGPAGNRGTHSAARKQTGTFYTPQPLAEFVVRRTLAPLVTGASADSILALRVVDPAMGSGAFLVAACRFLAAAYEEAVVDEGRASPADFDENERANVRRRIAEHCLAGVDVNPTAVQLARLSLWLTTLARGKPLGFLDHRLRVGNSLIGTFPDDLRRVPAGRRASSSPLPLLDVAAEVETAMRNVARPLGELCHRPDESVRDVHAKDAMWKRLTGERSPLAPWRMAADLWCARWFWPTDVDGVDAGPPPAPNEIRAAVDAIVRGDPTLRQAQLARWLHAAVRVSRQHAFFHWPFEFADVFSTGTDRAVTGFDAVIGNPPWEMLRRDRGASGDTRLVRFVRESGLFPSSGRGHVNLYQPFLDRALSLTRPGGRVGMVLPWGLATDEGAAPLRRRLLETTSLDTLVGLDNARGLFPVHRGLRMAVVVASAGGRTHEIRAAFGVSTGDQLDALPGRDTSPSAFPHRLTTSVIARVGGREARWPDARRAGDLALAERLSSDFPPLGSAAGWAVEFGRELNASDDRDAFGRDGLAVIEGKHISPHLVNVDAPTHRIRADVARGRLPDRQFERERVAYRDVSGVANRVSLVSAVIPANVVTTHTLFCLRTPLDATRQFFLCALLNSFVLNVIARMLMGGHLTTALVEGLPAPRWQGSLEELRISRLARALAAPARPDAARRRATSQAWLQALVARHYVLSDQELIGVLAGFPLIPVVERDAVLRIWRALDRARVSGARRRTRTSGTSR